MLNEIIDEEENQALKPIYAALADKFDGETFKTANIDPEIQKVKDLLAEADKESDPELVKEKVDLALATLIGIDKDGIKLDLEDAYKDGTEKVLTEDIISEVVNQVEKKAKEIKNNN